MQWVRSPPLCAELGLDPRRMNPHGGSIALSEPCGAAGARLITPAQNLFAWAAHTGNSCG
ncbi:hypothetical protein [Streptomyces sp. SD15]